MESEKRAQVPSRNVGDLIKDIIVGATIAGAAAGSAIGGSQAIRELSWQDKTATGAPLETVDRGR